MKQILTLVVAVIVTVECTHFLLGTNVNRPVLHSHLIEKSAKSSIIRSHNCSVSGNTTIQGILAYDTKHSNGTVELLEGGVGYTHAKLKVKGEKGKSLRYRVYIYG